MRTVVAFVGDVHGNLKALRGMAEELEEREVPHAVFLGDYINKGKHSAEVMGYLVGEAASGFTTTLLRGNHESALLDALDTGDLAAFLKMGGAMTIRSYIGNRVGPNVLEDFRAELPQEHLEAIRNMPNTYETDSIIAQHNPPVAATGKYRISAHIPIGKLPRIGKNSAQLDTGCGWDASGRLTALLWPNLDYVQVDTYGRTISGSKS